MAWTLVLTYHSISHGPLPLCLPPQRLARDLDGLAAAGFRAVPLSSVVDRLVRGRGANGGESGPVADAARDDERTFALTFDDAYRDFRDAAMPVLESRGVPATVFALAEPGPTLPGGTIPLLTIDELARVVERAGAAVALGAHSRRHDDLSTLAPAALEDDVRRCAAVLASLAGPPVDLFAYPFGRYDRRVRDAVGRHFRGACTTRMGLVADGAHPLEIPRVDAVYLESPALRRAIERGRARLPLALRRWARRARGLP